MTYSTVLLILVGAASIVEQVQKGAESADSVRGNEILACVLTALKVWPEWDAGDYTAVTARIDRAIAFQRDPTAFMPKPHLFRNITVC